jgi:hypothetical protein
VDEQLSWIIGLGNPITALMVGPTVATFWGPVPSRRVTTIGWLALFVTQLTFLAFGYASGYVAFRVAQPCMLPIAAWNYYLVSNSWATARRSTLASSSMTMTKRTTLQTSQVKMVLGGRSATASSGNGTRGVRARTFRQA